MKFFQVSSFTSNVFAGNPAGVCLLYGNWLEDNVMQSIAAQINLSETAFVLTKDGELFIRWFTPTVEVDLCGHATLAAAHVLFAKLSVPGLVFKSALYTLPVERENDMIVLDFPMAKIKKLDINDVPGCFNIAPIEAWTGHDEYMLVFNTEDEVKNAVCDLEKAKNIDLSGLIITAKSNRLDVDFVSRYFGPKIGIDEDPVTGSAHTILVPYWHQVTKKSEFKAFQLSKRGGELHCKINGGRVKIGGSAVTFLEGTVYL